MTTIIFDVILWLFAAIGCFHVVKLILFMIWVPHPSQIYFAEPQGAPFRYIPVPVPDPNGYYGYWPINGLLYRYYGAPHHMAGTVLAAVPG